MHFYGKGIKCFNRVKNSLPLHPVILLSSFISGNGIVSQAIKDVTMKQTREFEIAWLGLKPGEHNFQYDLDDRFFRDMEIDPEYKDISVKIGVRFDKQNGFFLLHFDVDGTVTVACDRCGDDFKLRLWDEFDLMIKLAGEDAGTLEEEADTVFISRSETVIDIRNWLYEFTMLSIPLQKVHPDLPDGKSGCNADSLQLLQQMSAKDKPSGALWKGLDLLKGKTEEE